MSVSIRLRFGKDVGMIKLGIIMLINMLKTLMDKVDNIQEQMGNISRKMKILRRIEKRNAINQKHCNRNGE